MSNPQKIQGKIKNRRGRKPMVPSIILNAGEDLAKKYVEIQGKDIFETQRLRFAMIRELKKKENEKKKRCVRCHLHRDPVQDYKKPTSKTCLVCKDKRRIVYLSSLEEKRKKLLIDSESSEEGLITVETTEEKDLASTAETVMQGAQCFQAILQEVNV